MALLNFAEQRLSPRRKLTGLLPGRMVVVGSNVNISCKPVDISAHGLGIVSEEILTAGSKLALRTHDREILLEVSWGQPDFGKRDLYRYGLVTVDRDVDLELVFADTGCLK